MPQAAAHTAQAVESPRWVGRALAWLTGTRARIVFGTAYGLAALVTAVGVWLVASAPAGAGEGALAGASTMVLGVLLANLLLIAVLAGAVGLRVLALVREQAEDAGARLHLRFVTLFSVVAVVRAIVVALVSLAIVNT